MTIAFYKVDNSQNYGRDTFNYYFDNGKAILEKLQLLNDDEWRTYDTSRCEGNGSPNLIDLQEDYNNELLDGGWWCIIIPN